MTVRTSDGQAEEYRIVVDPLLPSQSAIPHFLVSFEKKGALQPPPEFPDLCQVLSSPKVTLQQPESPASPPGTLTLNYGQETVIKTTGKSELFFTNP